MRKIKKYVRKTFHKTYFLRTLFNKMQDWRRRWYYKKYCMPLPIDEKLIVFEAFLGKQYACSPKAIYEAIKDRPEYADYRFVWAFRRETAYRHELGDERTIVVQYNSRRYYRMYAQAKYWISNGRLSEAIIKKEGQVFVQTWREEGDPHNDFLCKYTPDDVKAIKEELDICIKTSN